MMNSVTSSISPSQPMDAARTHGTSKISAWWQRLVLRFSEGAMDFRHEFQRRAKLKKVELALPIVERRIAAFLLSESTSEVVPLAEGSNIFRMADGGVVPAARPESPYERPELAITILGDRLLKEEREGAATRFVSNDRIVIGNRTYVVKVIPDEYRRAQRVEKGTSHE